MTVLLEIEIPCILLFLNRNRNSQNSSKRMHLLMFTETSPGAALMTFILAVYLRKWGKEEMLEGKILTLNDRLLPFFLAVN